jgi:hypothetical protein
MPSSIGATRRELNSEANKKARGQATNERATGAKSCLSHQAGSGKAREKGLGLVFGYKRVTPQSPWDPP